jgi:chemotaxis methyl-accepting protein methylase
MTIAITHLQSTARMTSIKQLNQRLFDLAPARWVGKYIYNWRRRYQPPTQSTTTKFFRNLQQLAALGGPLSSLTKTGNLSILVAGCSYGCEAYSLGGLLALRYPLLNWRIVAVDISREALGIADAARYTSEYGLGSARDDLTKQLEARLFNRSGDGWIVVADIRERISFAYGDVLSAEFQQFKNYDLVLGQNFMIHMDDASAGTALASLVAATRSGGALFLGGMDLETKANLLTSHQLVPLDWNIVGIHEADDMRRSAWPWYYWSLEPISRRRRDYLTRYSTIFLKP